MQDFTIFDMVIIGITLLLALKGLLKGLIKEVFGIIGIIGAIFVASRFANDIGNIIAPLLSIENETTIKLIGFIVTLVGFWLIVYILGIIVSKIFSASGLGIVDRIFGFIFGAAKIFLIFSVIAYAAYQVESFKKVIDDKSKNSMVMPHLLSVGSFIIKLDTTAISEKINTTVDNVTQTTNSITIDTKQTTKEIKESIDSTIENTKKLIEEEVIKKVEEQLSESEDKKLQDSLDSTKDKIINTINEENNKTEGRN